MSARDLAARVAAHEKAGSLPVLCTLSLGSLLKIFSVPGLQQFDYDARFNRLPVPWVWPLVSSSHLWFYVWLNEG